MRGCPVPIEATVVTQVRRLGRDCVLWNGIGSNEERVASDGILRRQAKFESCSCRELAVCAVCGSIWNE